MQRPGPAPARGWCRRHGPGRSGRSGRTGAWVDTRTGQGGLTWQQLVPCPLARRRPALIRLVPCWFPG